MLWEARASPGGGRGVLPVGGRPGAGGGWGRGWGPFSTQGAGPAGFPLHLRVWLSVCDWPHLTGLSEWDSTPGGFFRP